MSAAVQAPVVVGGAPDARKTSLGRRALRGNRADPAWVRPALLALLASTGALYLVGLDRSGWANGYYSAAVFAGSKSWAAFFFGSLDPANFITVDKPPLSLWPAVLAARLFGVNPWTILVPQAIEGVATVGLLYAAVRRHAPPLAGLFAGLTLAVTPVAAVMFRFNNPDALLLLLMVASIYSGLRAIEGENRLWILLTGVLLGLGFLTKLMQILIVVPCLVALSLVGRRVSFRRHIADLALGAVAMAVSAGWWIVAMLLVPPGSRPFIGGSQSNSIIDVTIGYNGFGRLTGHEPGSFGSTEMQRDPTRLFGEEMGNQVSWLLPAALLLLLLLLWQARRLSVRDPAWVPVTAWGGWFLVAFMVLSYSRGIVHAYYSLMLVPPMCALLGIGAAEVWRLRSHRSARLFAAVAVTSTVGWSIYLLNQAAVWQPWIRPAIATTVLVGAAFALVPAARWRAAGLVLTVAACLAGPTAWSIQTATTAHTGAQPTAGPPTGTVILHISIPRDHATHPTPDSNPHPTRHQPKPQHQDTPATMGGLLTTSRPSAALTAALIRDADSFRWVAATVAANDAAGLELAARRPVMALGGFNGTDPAISLAAFQKLVEQHRVHYFVADDAFEQVDPEGGSSVARDAIPTWIEQNFEASSFDTVVVYDLTAPVALRTPATAR